MHPNIINIISNNARVRDFYNVGPVQKAAIEDLVACIANEALNIVRNNHHIAAAEMQIYLDIAKQFDEHFTDRKPYV